MKKFIFPFFAALMLCSCGYFSGKRGGECDSDSVATCGEPEECEEVSDYLHPDTQMFELFGNVKSMKLTKYYEVSPVGAIKDMDNSYVDKKLYFNRNGEFDTYNSDFSWRLPNPQFDRNGKEQITKVTWFVEDYGCDMSDIYEYDKRGMVKRCEAGGMESSGTMTFKYDERTNLVSAQDNSAGEGYVFRTDITYTILETDAHLNWIKRLVKYDQQTGEDDGSGKFTESETYYEVEVRDIEYYE